MVTTIAFTGSRLPHWPREEDPPPKWSLEFTQKDKISSASLQDKSIEGFAVLLYALLFPQEFDVEGDIISHLPLVLGEDSHLFPVCAVIYSVEDYGTGYRFKRLHRYDSRNRHLEGGGVGVLSGILGRDPNGGTIHGFCGPFHGLGKFSTYAITAGGYESLRVLFTNPDIEGAILVKEEGLPKILTVQGRNYYRREVFLGRDLVLYTREPFRTRDLDGDSIAQELEAGWKTMMSGWIFGTNTLQGSYPPLDGTTPKSYQ